MIEPNNDSPDIEDIPLPPVVRHKHSELVRQPSVIDYGPLAGALPEPKIAPCDVDGLVEIDGNFLIIETKFLQENTEVVIPYGQELWLTRLSAIEGFTVLIVLIDRVLTSKSGGYFFIPRKFRRVGTDTGYKDINLVQFKQLYRRWYDFARANPRR